MERREYKLIFAGAMGAGKTTAISAISEIDPVKTEVQNTDRSAHSKPTTTTALDYGEVTLAGGDKLRLYGTPGQARFDYMWKILGTGALGVVVLVDNGGRDPVGALKDYVEAFGELARESRMVVGLGRTETHPRPTLDDHYVAVEALGFSVPILSVDVRRRDDVLLLLDVLFHQIETMDSEAAVGSPG